MLLEKALEKVAALPTEMSRMQFASQILASLADEDARKKRFR